MRLVVHIGTTKTGSSSLQSYLDLNRDALAAQRFYVPRSLGTPTHLKAVLAALPYGTSPDLARSLGATTKVQYESLTQNTIVQFHEEMATVRDDATVIITAEYLQSRLQSLEAVSAFRDIFCTNFRQTSIVMYVRPQIDHIVSLYSSVLREGNTQSLERFIETRMKPEKRAYFDFRETVFRWERAFGKGSMIIRPYKAANQALGVIDDFCDLLDICTIGQIVGVSKSENRSLSAEAQELLLLVNRGARDLELTQKVAAWADRYSTGPGKRPDPALAHKFQSLFTLSNQWIVGTYFPDHPEYLEPAPTDSPSLQA